jgi:dTDP-4-dehydrorhamnose reductase
MKSHYCLSKRGGFKLKIFITGGSGLLGCALAFELVKKHEVIIGYHHNYIEIKNDRYSSTNIDICNINSLRIIERVSPDVVIHTAALTDLEFCEKNPEIAYKINVEGTKNILQTVKDCNTKLVFICTDYIFDGKKGNYSEADKPNPVSTYAKTKLQGEELIKKDYDDFISIRTSLYGWSPNKLSFASWIINSLKKNERISVLSDQISSMLFTNDLANILNKMLEYDLRGTYNVVSSDYTSKYNFALKIAEIFGLNKSLIDAISLDNLIKKFSLSANRPKNVSLNVFKIEKELGRRMNSTTDGIISMKEKEFEFKKSVTAK